MIQFPLKLTFKIVAFAQQYSVTDATGAEVFYVKQKAFKFKEDIKVSSNSSQSDVLFTIKANKWIDFSATYSFGDANGNFKGSISRKGMRSIWKANYIIHDENKIEEFTITEDNAWVKVMDAFLKEIPILSIFNGYFFNPSYTVKRPDGTPVVQLKKDKSFFGRSFSINKLGNMDSDEENRALLGLMLMSLLERYRG